MLKINRPSYLEMISQAIVNLRRKEGSSLVAIENYILDNFDIDLSAEVFRRQLKLGLKRATEGGALMRNKGSYLIGDGNPPEKKKAPKKEEKKEENNEEEEEEKEEEEEDEESLKKIPKIKPAPKKKEKEEESKEKAPSKKRGASPKKKESKRAKTQKKEGEEKPSRKSPAKRKKGNVADKEIIVKDVLPNVTTSGVLFNTTDIVEVRMDIKAAIEKLLTDDNIRVGIIANRGWKETQYNLEVLDFSDDPKEIARFVENSFGEGFEWLKYYKQVLEKALDLSWANHKLKTLILIGNEGIDSVRDVSLQAEVGKLATLGVKVFAFHHSQLFLLEEVLSELN